MDASSSSSASSNPSSSKKPISESPSLASLPEELIARILAKCREEWEFFTVALVSPQFRRLSEDPTVLRSVGYRMIAKSRWTSASYRERLLKKCLEGGEPHAQFVQGKADYFANRRRERGLKLLLSSASQGHPEALYVSGMVLFCLGGPDRQKGLNMLNSLRHPSSVYESMIILDDLKLKSDLIWWGTLHVAKTETFRMLERSYDRDPCQCNGKTTTFVEMGALKRWRKVIRGKGLSASELCLICFWDNQVHRFVCCHG